MALADLISDIPSGCCVLSLPDTPNSLSPGLSSR